LHHLTSPYPSQQQQQKEEEVEAEERVVETAVAIQRGCVRQ